jgi:hypothetical protein
VITEAEMIRRWLPWSTWLPSLLNSDIRRRAEQAVSTTLRGSEIRPDASGFLQLTDEGVEEDFAQHLTVPEKNLIAAIQGQVSGPNELRAKVNTVAWKAKPTFYIVADHDRMIAPELEKKIFAEQMHAKTIHIASSLVPMLSHPVQVAEFHLFSRGGAVMAGPCRLGRVLLTPRANTKPLQGERVRWKG